MHSQTHANDSFSDHMPSEDISSTDHLGSVLVPQDTGQNINTIHTTQGPHAMKSLQAKVFLPPLQLKPYRTRVKSICLIMEA